MIKRKLFSFLNLIGVPHILRRRKNNTLTVLSLHRISDERDYFWNPITPATFEKLLHYVKKYYTVISFADISLLENKTSQKPFLILSFDDGYYDFYQHAFPLLKKYNLPCNHNIVNDCVTNNKIIWTQRLNTIFNHCKNRSIDLSFIIEGGSVSLESFTGNWMKFYLKIFKILLKIGQQERLNILTEKENEFSLIPVCKMMNWQQVAECSENLVEIGCHTYSHDVLSTIRDVKILQKEIIDSANEIEKKIRKKVHILALPNGEGNEKINEILKESEMKYVLYVGDKINKFSQCNANVLKNIYRINLVEESIAEMILRIELFHTKIRKYA